ncbi:MAG: hypothetical protein ABSD53_23345 [Terriglobales bacterium]
MEARTPKFGGGANETVLHPLVLILMLLGLVLFFVLPRKYVIVPVLLTMFLVPAGQQFYIAGIHLFVQRILILVGFIRARFMKGPNQKHVYAGGWNSIDTAFTFYVVISAAATMAQYPDAGALVNQIGYLWDFLLGYLLLRSLIQSEEDSFLVIKCFAGLMVILGAAMIYEQMKMVNLFGLLGGVNAVPEVRDGKIRSQAVFQHSLTAGTFAATAIPLFFLLWKNGKAKLLSIVGIVGATVMTVTTQTSTSLLTYAAGILAVFAWPLRKKMKKVRTAIVVALISLHLVMKAPVWFLIARIDLTGSSSSYHRAELIDQFINHFSSWWLIGTKDAATWGWDMWDAQNMYVSVGEAGGLAALVFYILVISRSFARIGEARKRARNKQQQWFLWFLGAALFANVVAFFGVNYFDQSRMAWFALISMISACTIPLANSGVRFKAAEGVVALQEASVPVRRESEPSDAEVEIGRSTNRYLLD